MRADPLASAVLAAACAAGAGLAASCGAPQPAESVLAGMPAEIAGARATGVVESYLPAAIFSYLDGGAEVYLAYGLRSCHVRRYAWSGGEVIVDLFDMGSGADAFGVFSRDLEGEAVAVGQGGRLRGGWLSAWKGRFYASITAERDDPGARAVLEALGRAVAAGIREAGEPPALLRVLPPEGLDVARVAYAHDHVSLAAHVTLPEGNPLGLGATTEVAVGRYRRGGAVATLLLCRHSDAAAAEAGAVALARAWASAPGVATRAAGGRWRAAAAQGAIVAVALDAVDEESVHALLADALAAGTAR